LLLDFLIVPKFPRTFLAFSTTMAAMQGQPFQFSNIQLTDTIPDTLDKINAGFAALSADIREMLSFLISDSYALAGFGVAPTAFPEVQIAAGTLFLKDGSSYQFPAGTVTLPNEPNTTQIIYIDSQYTVQVGTVVPADAIATLGTFPIDASGTGLLDFSQPQTLESLSYDAEGRLAGISKSIGGAELQSVAYAYDANGFLSQVTETTEAQSKAIAYTTNAAGFITGISYEGGPRL
jgi:hypothetical protein